MERPDSEEPTVSSLYAAAAARVVVTSRRSFVASCGEQRLTGEVMAIGYVQSSEAASLEAAVERLIGDDAAVDTTDEWAAMHAAEGIFDPDALLAWLLTEGVSLRH